jgi:signal transduction histidine kinase
MSFILEKKLPFILLFALLMLAMLGYLTYLNNQSLQQAIDWQKKTQEILLALDETLSATVEIDNSGRGFVLTGNEDFFISFKYNDKQASEKLGKLESLIKDEEQFKKLERLREKIYQKISNTERFIAYRRTLSLEVAAEEFAKLDEKALMLEIRSLVAQMKTEELRLLKVREENLQKTLNNNFWLMVSGSTAGTLSLAAAFLVLIFEMKKRRKAETALIEANRDLEKRVELRTQELQQANFELLQISDEKERLFLGEQAARREAEIANRQRDEFMAMISHELRTPLNSILGWARIIKNEDIDNQTHTKAIETIIKNAETQNRLIKDLLDVARIISGKLTLEFQRTVFADLVVAAVESVKPSAEAKSLLIELHIAEKAKEKKINGDIHRLRQIVMNLLTNAVKFTPEGGKIDVNLTENDRQIILEVKDNGIGITADFLPFVFERFRQDKSIVRKSGGLGLGLAIVRYLTEMHGGQVNVKSEGKNKGATFTVSFPTGD